MILVHITDLSDTGRSALPAPYRNSPLVSPVLLTTRRKYSLSQPFHTDPTADVIAMFVLQPSIRGGQGTLCPVASIYNDLASTRPDLLCELAKPDWPFDRPPNGQGSVYHRPVMFLGGQSAAPEMLFSRGALIRSPQKFRLADVPLLSRRQGAALDAVHFSAEGMAYRVEYQKGDVIFINNRRVLHGREGFQDGDDGKRHMLRLWLRDEELAGTPPKPLDGVWEAAFAAGEEAQVETEEGGCWPLVVDGA